MCCAQPLARKNALQHSTYPEVPRQPKAGVAHPAFRKPTQQEIARIGSCPRVLSSPALTGKT
jgi:hypothetical protein